MSVCIYTHLHNFVARLGNSAITDNDMQHQHIITHTTIMLVQMFSGTTNTAHLPLYIGVGLVEYTSGYAIQREVTVYIIASPTCGILKTQDVSISDLKGYIN